MNFFISIINTLSESSKLKDCEISRECLIGSDGQERQMEFAIFEFRLKFNLRL